MLETKIDINFVNQLETVAQHVAHPLVVGAVIGSNLGLTPRHK